MTHFMELLLCWTIRSWAVSKATLWSEVWLCWRTCHFSCFIFILSLDFHKSYLQAEKGFPCFPIRHDVRKNTAIFFCLPWPPVNTTQIKIHVQCLADAFHQSTDIKYSCLSRRILFFLCSRKHSNIDCTLFSLLLTSCKQLVHSWGFSSPFFT